MKKQVTPGPPIQRQIHVNMAEATPQACKCGNEYFREVHKIMVLSALAKGNPTGKNVVAPLKFSQCIYCKEIFKG